MIRRDDEGNLCDAGSHYDAGSHHTDSNHVGPASAPAPAPALDVTSFPHILDRIVLFAPHAALVALSQTSRALRDHTRPLLFEHVRLCDHLPFRSKLHLTTASRPRIRLATLPGASPAELAHTHTLDMDLHPTCDSAVHFPRLAVLRRAPRSAMCRYVEQTPAAHTVVDTVLLLGSDYEGRGGLHTVTYLPPYWTEHHVVHITWDARADVRIKFDDPPGGVRRTIVLHPSGGTLRLADIQRATVVGVERGGARVEGRELQFETYEAWRAGEGRMLTAWES
ncbi:hypothetical protein CC85DRAFT_282677 [Cutaneotrichosporon oleaginosum]|uniref:Uncharacterized protein n=1 Tax=Cutaneotrichosporon oleaginosum TaxID=879819 RepID=A0A0J0XVS2_9TREE|nr:uncharacterized protein CC85DRAFT_282677 [Cutaneotrichosporon oleaginosum]KLT45182.1 hypothetical protein CC85DRAFT_282677 [Cutaneotrichosporon oleaginosum]TXT14981.1 hypothetical protein COLE_01174 [Cutaneotrichosporon oleaginosum]